MRIVLAPNAFKGTYDAIEVARAWEASLAGRAEVLARPLSDGGDGFLAVVRRYRPAVIEVAARVPAPAGRAIQALWGWDPEGGTAVLESAAAIGLARVEPAERDPLALTSAGLGRLIRTAAGLAPEEIVVGLGGSATVDGGLGMARSLGYAFEDSLGRPLERPEGLARLARIRRPDRTAIERMEILALADVTAPLHGPAGAARRFGPQKGADAGAVERLAEGLDRMAERWVADLGVAADLAGRAGAGAAGGLGGALAAFLGARIASGAAWCGGLAGLDEALAGADVVVTGEGRFDRQSAEGKATGHVLARARAAGVPAAVVCAEAGRAAEAPDPGDAIVVDGAAIGRGPGDPLGLDDLVRLLDVALGRWRADARGGG